MKTIEHSILINIERIKMYKTKIYIPSGDFSYIQGKSYLTRDIHHSDMEDVFFIAYFRTLW